MRAHTRRYLDTYSNIIDCLQPTLAFHQWISEAGYELVGGEGSIA